jgi:1,4-dihydroxy-6-naphthoate synthase
LPADQRTHRRSLYDVAAISSVAYPAVADHYAILSVGTSVGRGYGPVLVSKHLKTLEEIRGRRVGVGGIPTTGWFLLRWLCPEAIVVEMAFDRIGDAIASGELDAGVMIHEELLYYPRLGLHRVEDLGARWCQDHGLPLPVGLNVIRRELGSRTVQQICSTLRQSLRYGQDHRVEALQWVCRFGRGTTGQCTSRFVEMFANKDSMHLAPDVRLGLRVLFNQCIALEIAEALPPLDIIEGWRPFQPLPKTRSA